ncbi:MULTISPECIES: AraC family transcriptional regulator [Nonlabens]|uniref:AraC family transcriptional regulator n=1 Tax=Nonlabens xylanidelens TaxID=191564 RepID=A0A2S6IRY7_9FLAO|nr:AraC family transcriptional regulator [Nonlabens xylanidelens]PPK96900.1 AraC family transcriptional regulator [Nonlabens xylanidelens]PQJ13598.1 AraC family transcriptional regulator [Nonlabens xylanidelens]
MENIAKGAGEVTIIEDGFHVIRLKNDSAEKTTFSHHVDSSFLQFHYCLKGSVQLAFNEGSYKLDLKEQNSYLLYNPSRDLPMDLSIAPNTWFISVLVSIKKFHSLFSPDAQHVSFLSADNKDKKYYVDGKISPSMAVALHQLMNYNLNDTIKQLYFKGKSYELLSLYFNTEEEANLEACPFLADEENMRKIKRAKEIVIERMIDLPSLQELSIEIGLSLKKLKEGFKEVYGDTVFGFALSHKMDYARQLLDSGQHNVNEVGLKVGYSTGSHFISAFKKKYGTTPKRYISGK